MPDKNTKKPGQKYPLAPGTIGDRELPDPVHLRRPEPPPEHPAVKAGVQVVQRASRTESTPKAEHAPAPPTPPMVQTARLVLASVRNVKVKFEKPFCAPSDEELNWVLTPTLGSQARVFRTEDGKRVRFAGHAAVMVLNYSEEPDLTTVYVRVRFYPDVGADWERKLKKERGKRLGELEESIAFALARVALRPGLVLRFAGGPPMAEVDARVSGYTFWNTPDRAPVRAQFTRDYIAKREEELRMDYYAVRSKPGLVASFLFLWWRIFRPARLSAYREGRRLANTRERMQKPSGKGADPFGRDGQSVADVVSRLVAPVMQSLVSVVWYAGSDPKYRNLLVDQGVPLGEERMTRLGTIVDDGDQLYGGKPKVKR